jgi:hypothetical protein
LPTGKLCRCHIKPIADVVSGRVKTMADNSRRMRIHICFSITYVSEGPQLRTRASNYISRKLQHLKKTLESTIDIRGLARLSQTLWSSICNPNKYVAVDQNMVLYSTSRKILSKSDYTMHAHRKQAHSVHSAIRFCAVYKKN